jgi:hypothetical protein
MTGGVVVRAPRCTAARCRVLARQITVGLPDPLSSSRSLSFLLRKKRPQLISPHEAGTPRFPRSLTTPSSVVTRLADRGAVDGNAHLGSVEGVRR